MAILAGIATRRVYRMRPAGDKSGGLTRGFPGLTPAFPSTMIAAAFRASWRLASALHVASILRPGTWMGIAA